MTQEQYNAVSLPDHPMRSHWAYQAFYRLPRGLLLWVSLIASAWALGVADVTGHEIDLMTRALILLFVAAHIGSDKWYQAFKGVS